MNVTQFMLSSTIIAHADRFINPDHLIYIGFGIGSIGGLISACIIACYKYNKKKQHVNDVKFRNSVAL